MNIMLIPVTERTRNCAVDSSNSVSIGFAIFVGVGLFFGYYPPNLAANLDPIACLRYQ
jgi:hypothetical protein